MEPKDREILALTIPKERNMFVAERFISGLVQIYGAPGINRRRDLVPAGMQISQNKTSHPFPIGEKHDRKDNAVHQGQDRKF